MEWISSVIFQYKYPLSRYKDKTVSWQSYVHNGTSYIGKLASLYWDVPQGVIKSYDCPSAVESVLNITKVQRSLNTLRPRQNGRRFADDTFKRIFLNENVRISIKISLKFVPKGPINNIPALVQIMAWRRSGDKPLSEPVMVRLLTYICVTRPQWVNSLAPGRFERNFI